MDASTMDTETPREAGFSMPPEWEPHAATLMAWPVNLTLWGDRLADAEADYGAVARAIAAFEPVIMVCPPGSEDAVRNACGVGVEPLPMPIDDSWLRDSGPTFVRDGAGRIAAVKFQFNAWGERFHPYDSDAAVPYRVAEHLGMRVFTAPFVMEGGSFFVDGEGTVLTTEMCLLHPNRNPSMSREQIEQGLRDYLGVETVVWLPYGMAEDVGPEATDGHVDGVAQFVGPGRVLLLSPSDPGDPDHTWGKENLTRLQEARDARGRSLQIDLLDGPHANFYLANGAAIVPVYDDPRDEDSLERIARAYPGREVVPVPGKTLAYGGGGPHCITQQIPVGDPAPSA